MNLLELVSDITVEELDTILQESGYTDNHLKTIMAINASGFGRSSDYVFDVIFDEQDPDEDKLLRGNIYVTIQNDGEFTAEF